MQGSDDMKQLAKAIRKDIIDITYHAKTSGGHIGGALSCADILAVLYGHVMKISPRNVCDPERDRFILSKGHVALGLYATLAECGFISKEEMMTFEDSGSLLPTHTCMNVSKGIETSSGSLGYGLSIGVGIALAGKKRGKTHHVFVLLGDGECNEGSVWEAVMSAAKFKLDNLIAIIDINNQQNDGFTKDIIPIHSFNDIFSGFGWAAINVDGNNIEELIKVFDNKVGNEGKPTVILASTIKGKGIKSIENKVGWHHARINDEQYIQFLQELEA